MSKNLCNKSGLKKVKMCEQRERKITRIWVFLLSEIWFSICCYDTNIPRPTRFERNMISAIAEIEKEREDKIAFELKQLNKENRNGN